MSRFDGQDFFTPERGQKLDLLLHLLRNGRKPILLRAPAGAGKTYLLTKLSDRLEQTGQVIRLDRLSLVHDVNGLLDSLESILSTENLPISAYLSGKSANDETIYLLGEDIHAMSDDGLNALLGLFNQYDCVQLVLTASENVAQVEQWCQVINLEPFSQRQTVEYAKHLIAEMREPASRLNGFDELVLFIETGGLPGRIHDAVSKTLLSVPTASVVQPHSQQRSNVFYIIPSLAVLFAVAIAALLYLDDGAVTESTAPTLATPKIVQKDRMISGQAEIAPVEKVGTVKLENEEKISDSEPTTESAPTAFVLTEVEPQLNQDATKLNVEKVSQAVGSPKLLENKVANPVEQKLDAVAERPVSKVVEVNSKGIVAESKPEFSPLEVDKAWILSMPPDQYSFQIMGLGKLSSALGYVQKLPKRENVYIYQSKRNNGAWYGILYGVYADKTAASQSLPEVKQLFPGIEPWARSFDSIQKDLY